MRSIVIPAVLNKTPPSQHLSEQAGRVFGHYGVEVYEPRLEGSSAPSPLGCRPAR